MKNNIFGLIDLFSKLVYIFTAGILASSLGPSLYGAWILLVGLQVLLINLTSFGFTTSMQRLLPFLDKKKQSFYFIFSVGTVFIFNLLAFFILFALKEEILDSYNIKMNITNLVLPIAFLSMVNGIEALIDCHLKIREEAFKYFGFVVFKTTLEIGSLLYFFKFSVSEANASTLLKYLLTILIFKGIGYLILLIPYFSLSHDFSNLKKYLKYGIPTVIASCVLWGFGNLDKVILTRYMTLDQLGNYSFGATLAMYLTYVGSVITPLLMPRLSFIYDKSGGQVTQKLVEYFNQNLTCVILAVSGLFLLVSLFSREIIRITAGSKFPFSYESLFFLALYYGIDQIIGLWAYVYHLYKKPLLLTSIRTGYFFIFVAGIFISLQFFPAKYLPVSIFVLGLAYNLLLYIVAQRLISIKMSKRNFMIVLCSLSLSFLNFFILYQINMKIKLVLLAVATIFSLAIFFRELVNIDRLYKVIRSG